MFRRLFQFGCVLLASVSLAGCHRQASDSADPSADSPPAPSAEFLSLMNAGKNHLDRGDATNALATYRRAADLAPHDPDVHLNLANAHLLAGEAREAVREADEVLKRTPNSAAAHFVKGSAHLRLGNAEEAVQAFENVRRIDLGDTATCFQLGRARLELRQWDAAIAAFKEGIALDPNRLHTAAHYLLGQALLRAGRTDEGRQELQLHQANLEAGGNPGNVEIFERSKYTQPRVPFVLEQPDPVGIPVVYTDATADAFGDAAARFTGPLGVIDPDHRGEPALLAREKDGGFRLLRKANGTFQLDGETLPVPPGRPYRTLLVGDLQNDRFDDVIVLGDEGSRLFCFGTNGQVTDLSEASHLGAVRAEDGVLMDLDFTGKLDLLVVAAPDRELRLLRQFGPLSFVDITATSGIPAQARDLRGLAPEDWNRDGTTDLLVTRGQGPPLLLEKQRGGPLLARDTNTWATGPISCTGDFDNDLRPDLALAGPGRITLHYQAGNTREILLPATSRIESLIAIDHDSDGWLDLWAIGEGIRAWRNRGLAGFEERTTALGLDRIPGDGVSALRFADFDGDCDPDVVVALAGGGLRYLRNEGASVHSLVKVQLFGNRSNASGLGCRIEIETGGLRVSRTVRQLPVEIGVGRHQVLDSFLVHWFNWPQGSAEVPVNCQEPILAMEAFLQEGSCPYLYAWDGLGFRFVTDFLGAAPLGLPVSEGRMIEADPEELIWIGTDETFPPRDGSLQLRITEELREVLYLDEARLMVVDHPPGLEVHPTDKLLPSGPFPRGTLLALHREHPLRRAETDAGIDVTDLLRAVDGRRASPPRLRIPQLRGLAEPHGLILDFGPLDHGQPLVLVMNGWLRFGGGMANIAASHDPALPFPFPVLEAEIAPGTWEKVDVVVGAPAGKTKTILVDLEGRLTAGTRRLRLTGAFEIHWDRIALLEKAPLSAMRVHAVEPTSAQLRFRGFSALRDLPADWPLTPDYEQVSPNSPWTLLPEGWATRYGDVRELIVTRDEGLALVHSGDELSLDFAVTSLPPKPAGARRQFFLYVDGWDKDADFHVVTGTRIEPLPFHGMNDQQYGRERRPAFPSDSLHRKYNTRWVDGRALRQTARP